MPWASQKHRTTAMDKSSAAYQAAYERQRAGTRNRGLYGRRWREYRVSFLTSNPLCTVCTARGHTTAATVVDHIKPHCGDDALFWDESNHQPLCKLHHDQKTATQDGAFGRARKE